MCLGMYAMCNVTTLSPGLFDVNLLSRTREPDVMVEGGAKKKV